MIAAPLPPNEMQRLARLRNLGVLDTLPQKAFDDIAALASTVCGTPIALISLVDRDREWFMSRHGPDRTQLSRELSFCAHAILQDAEVMVVPDAAHDPRFMDNPLVIEAPMVRFYAAAPIVTPDGFALGTVCVFDQHARPLTAIQIDALRTLADLVVTLLEHERLRLQDVERQSREARVHHERLVAMSTSGLDVKAYISRDYDYLHVNETYLDYWGCTREEVVGHTVQERLGDDLFNHFLKARLDMALSGQPVFFQRTVDYKVRGPRHMDVALLPVRDPAGAVIGLVMRSHDIQLIKEKEAELSETVALLEHRTREQERFIHIISHDLREPINSINNFTSLLSTEHQHEFSADSRRYLAYVQAGGQRMIALLDDLLHYVELEQHTLDKTWIDANALFRQIRDDLDAALERSHGQLLSDPLPMMLLADASLLRIALQNLVANGLKFSRPGVAPVVRLSSSRADGFLFIHVTDNGIGIAPEHQASIFGMFKRLHPRKAYEGSGLGLSICRRIAELHGGQLAVTSNPDHGCRFTLQLPLPQHPPAHAP
jgi:PAS domain S-box-containing protein